MNIGIKTLSAQDLREVSTVQKEAIGSIAASRDGNLYVYGKAGGTLTSGQLAVAEAVVANHTNRTVAASQVVGDTEVQVNMGATAAAADLYADGYLVVNDAQGEGVAYKIAGNSVSAGSDVCRVRLYDPITKALTVSVSEVSLIKHPAKDAAASTTLAKAVGVVNVDVASGSFGYFQKTGVCSVTADGTPAKNNRLIQSNGTAGSVEVQAETDVIETVGIALETWVSTENRACVLSIA